MKTALKPSAPLVAIIRAKMGEQHKRPYQLAKVLNTSDTTVSRRLYEINPFTIDELYKVASWLNTTVPKLTKEAEDSYGGIVDEGVRQ